MKNAIANKIMNENNKLTLANVARLDAGEISEKSCIARNRALYIIARALLIVLN